MSTVIINPGVCGLNTTVQAVADEDQAVIFTVETDCPHIRAMADSLDEVDGYQEAFAKLGDGAIYKAAHAHCKHAACPVPSGFVKALEVACGLALPKDVNMQISKD